MSSPLLRLWHYGWAAPCTLLGLLGALPLLAAGGAICRRQGVIEIVGGPDGRRLFGRFGAITFGHVVIAASPAVLDRLRAHEHAHVAQYERWGLLLFPAYAMSSLWQWLRGRDPHRDNAFEVQARRICGEQRTPGTGRPDRAS